MVSTDVIRIETKRLMLRSIGTDDANRVFVYRSDSETNRFQGWIPTTIDDVNDFITNRVAKEFNIPRSWHQLVIVNKNNDEIIGDIGVHFLDQEGYQVEIGCTLDIKHQGNGYATEALSELIGSMFGQFNKHRVIASIDPQNVKSIALVKRLGFRKEAHFRESILINNVWSDDLIYSLLKVEWDKKMEYSKILEMLSPCGLNCGKCFAFIDGDIRENSIQLKKALGNFDVYAERFAGLLNNPVFKKFPDFKEVLEYFSTTECNGCRKEKCKLFDGCLVKECAKRNHVDFCFQCSEFPCNKTGFDEHLRKRSVDINRRMKEIGVQNYYQEIKDQPRY